MNEPIRELDEFREQIDRIDLDLLHLLNSRAEVVLELQRTKRELGLPSYSAARESEIVQRVRNANKGPFPDGAVEDIFRRVLQHSLSSLVQVDE